MTTNEGDLTKARFIVHSDPRADNVIFPLPEEWWSRPYEYYWCGAFAGAEDIVLDAACGIGHPFKFYLSTKCKEVYACDADPRIVFETAVLEDVRATFGDEAVNTAWQYLRRDNLFLSREDITALSFPDRQFTLVFCISVLEHMSVPDMKRALQEFHRVLQPGGRLVMTVDYPVVDLPLLYETAAQIGFQPGEVDYALGKDALTSTRWGRLFCYRIFLAKAPAVE